MFPFASNVNVFPVPVLSTSKACDALLPLASLAVTVKGVVPLTIGIDPVNRFAPDTSNGFPPTVTVAGSLTVPSNRIAPDGC